MNIPGYNELTDVERALVEWQYRLCGDFHAALWKAIAHADGDNLERLRLGFPVEVEGFIRFSQEPGFWSAICKKAGGDVEAGY